MAGFVDRVAAEAVQVRPLKMFLTVVTVPFYVLGWVIGLLWVALVFAVGAIRVGISDARAKASRPDASRSVRANLTGNAVQDLDEAG